MGDGGGAAALFTFSLRHDECIQTARSVHQLKNKIAPFLTSQGLRTFVVASEILSEHWYSLLGLLTISHNASLKAQPTVTNSAIYPVMHSVHADPNAEKARGAKRFSLFCFMWEDTHYIVSTCHKNAYTCECKIIHRFISLPLYLLYIELRLEEVRGNECVISDTARLWRCGLLR